MSHHTLSANTSLSWRRNLAAIWFAELVAIVGFSVVLPLLPLYVPQLGVQDEQEVKVWSGLIYTAHAVTMAILGPIWGAISDRHGRKVMVERAMFSGAIVIGLMGLARTVQQLAILRMLQGALTGTVTAATALVATNTPREHAGYALGLLQMAVYAGASVGPLLGGLVADTLGYRATFWVTGVLLFLAGMGVLFFVREEFHPVASRERPGGAGLGEAASQARVWNRLASALGPAVLGVLGVRLVMRLGSNLLSPVLPLFVRSIIPAGARVATTTGLVSGASAAAGAVGALGLGWLGDRVGYRSILLACAAISVVCYVPQAFARTPAALLLWQAGTGLAMGGILASVSAWLARLAPEGREGIIYGMDATFVSVANAIGPLLGSVLAVWLGLRAPFLFAAGVFGVAGVAIVRLWPGQKSERDLVSTRQDKEKRQCSGNS